MHINIPNVLELDTRVIVLCVCLVIWELVRKGIALYRAGQRNNYIWFIFIFILNTCGILPIIYLALNKKKKH